MVFSSITFLFYFLPIFLAAYFLTPTIQGKNVVTLLFSLVFYAWGEPRFVIILLISIAFNFCAGLLIDSREGSTRRLALAVAVAGNLLLLGIFKYANFITANLTTLLHPLGARSFATNIALPLGISFFTFHCLSYIIDVYRRRFKANRNPIDIALYISLFPQLVAGPIVRYKTVARQLDARRFTLGRASVGARIFIIGLAQKVLVADVVAPLVQVAFDTDPHRSMAEAWIGLISYTVQIYFDFAGYSNMAIGLGIVLGFTFPRNFRMPYTSLSITEFWRRWHMSLSSWLRDYLYIPLGGSRGSQCADLPQSHHGVPALRALARGELDVRPVGRLARRLPGDRAPGLGGGARPSARGQRDGPMRCSPSWEAGCCSARPTCRKRSAISRAFSAETEWAKSASTCTTR